jgi:hypothetical protein
MLFFDFVEWMTHFVVDLKKDFGSFGHASFAVGGKGLFGDDLGVELEFVDQMCFKLFVKLLVPFLVIVEVQDDKLRSSTLKLRLNLSDPVIRGESLIFTTLDINKTGLGQLDTKCP